MLQVATKLPAYAEGTWNAGKFLAQLPRLPMLVRTLVRSMIDVWPDAVYRERIVETRLLGQPLFFVIDPKLIRTLLVDEAASLEREEVVDRALAAAVGKGILTSDGALWRTQRRTATPVFRPDSIRAFVPAMAQAARETVTRWRSTDPQKPLDLLTEMKNTTFDIIVATMISNHDVIDVDAFATALDTYLAQTNWKMALATFGAPAWTPHPGSRRGVAAAKHMRDSVERIILARRAKGDDGSDLLGLLLAMRDPDTDQPMSLRSIVDNLLTFIAAGHETTALALTWTFRLIADHPGVEARILKEIEAVGADFRADPSAVDRLTYTKQVLSEAMRLYPPAPLILRRTTKAIELGGRTIPAGCSVHVPVYALHRHERLWNEPERFDPDRFAPEQQKSRDRYAFLPFGAGPRICIGMGMAMTECLIVLATVLPAFRLQPVRASMPSTRFRITLRPHGGMPMYATPRGDPT